MIEKDREGVERNQNEKHAKGKQMSGSHMPGPTCAACSGKQGRVWSNSIRHEETP